MSPDRENNLSVSASAVSVLQLPERLPAASEKTAAYPHHTEDIAQGLEKLFLDAALRERLQKEGLRRAAMFSWENAAAALYDVYQEALTR